MNTILKKYILKKILNTAVKAYNKNINNKKNILKIRL